jgi:hypothetical protein
LTGQEPGGTDPLARFVFAGLIIACFAAFFITQRLKHTPTALQEFKLAGRFSPYAAPGHNQEPISFKLEHAEDVTVKIVATASGNTVATLLSRHPVARYKHLSLRWNGRRGSARSYTLSQSPGGRAILVPNTNGAFVAPGEYRVEVSLLGQGHPVSSNSFTVVGR